MLVPIKWNEYQQKLREYDACIARVERSDENNKFFRVLIEVVSREGETQIDIADELEAAFPPLLSKTKDCPIEPTFKRVFFTSSSDTNENGDIRP